jgi:hypothetical protein
MYVRLNYGPYVGEIRDLRHDAAVAAIESGRADKAEFVDGAWIVPIAEPASAVLTTGKTRK